VQTVVNSL